jgi:ankyrin repeat protein
VNGIASADISANGSALEVPDINVEDAWRRTALHLAAERGHKTVVEELLKRQANIDVVDKFQKTALHYAAKISEQRCESGRSG